MSKSIALILTLMLYCVPSLVLAQAAGHVVAVRQSAQVTSGDGTRDLTEGSEIASGDQIKTGESGEVQIVFLDETRIVVGRNSVLVIDQTLFKSDGTAKKFAAKALGGTFRFISGESPKQVYKIATPLATMGIRGTEFDFTVGGARGADLLVFKGEVRFCNRNGRCVTVPGGCSAVSIGRSGLFSQPETDEEQAALLDSRFPLISAQDRLQPEFRVGTDGCVGVNLIALPAVNERTEQERAKGAERDEDPGGNPAQ